MITECALLIIYLRFRGILLQGRDAYEEAIQSYQLAIKYRPTLACKYTRSPIDAFAVTCLSICIHNTTHPSADEKVVPIRSYALIVHSELL